MEKDAITRMNLQELSDFPLDDFFDHYERGLRRVSQLFAILCEFHSFMQGVRFGFGTKEYEVYD